MKKFVIVSPRQKYGGPIVLHNLCKSLNSMGYNAKIFYLCTVADSKILTDKSLKTKLQFYFISLLKFNIDLCKVILGKIFYHTKISDKPFLKGYGYVPIKGIKRKILPIVDDETIVVYPEICYNNFLNAKHVVRWFLYHNRYKNDKNAYGKNDLFISFSQQFNDYDLNPECKIVRTTYFDVDLYKKTNFSERKGTCYFIRKGKNRPDLPKKFDGPILDNYSERDIVKALNKYEKCISYDTQTFYSSIAACCGCLSIVVPEEGKSREDYISKENGYGRAYGFSKQEIKYAMETHDLLIKMLYDINLSAQSETKKFLRYCNEHFGEE